MTGRLPRVNVTHATWRRTKTTGHIGGMANYLAIETTGGRRFAAVERALREPGWDEVRIRVHACGICHTDAVAVEADGGAAIVPGHEVVGVIEAIGPAPAQDWRVGERVGVGFLGGHCGRCTPCRRGDFVNCADQPRLGLTADGGYAEVLYARSSGLVRIPDELSAVEAAPLLCAGLTTFQALQQGGARPGALVAIQGLGGLGHLGVQYAARLGHRVAVVARGEDKRALAERLGAEHYVDSTTQDPGEALQALGGAAAIVATAASGASMSPLVHGLAPRGRLVVVGAAADPVQVDTLALIFGTRSIAGSLTGTPIENEDNLAFAAQRGIRPMLETFPLAEAEKAYELMISGAARFRAVLTTQANEGANA
jgi:propanol-preferring alcohol dehydrogenase